MTNPTSNPASKPTSKTHHTKLLIIGSGAAGYTAAIYAARAMLAPTLLQGIQPGGQLTITTDVDNYPGFADTIQGPTLMAQMEAQARRMGTKIINDTLTKADLTQRPFHLTGSNDTIYSCDALIIATGAKAKWLGLASEQTFMGYGVSACATCDGPLYKGKKLLVVGGGNTAVEEALFLTKFASEVILIHRRDQLRAEKILQQKLFDNKKISVRWWHILEEICGTKNPLSVTHAKIKNTKTNTQEELACDGVFIAIGHEPQTDLFTPFLEHKDNGILITKPNSTQSSIKGIFAAGDVMDDKYRQAVTAAGTGCMAALDAEQFLSAL